MMFPNDMPVAALKEVETDNQPFYPTGSVWDIESCVNFLLQICLVRGLGNIY